MKSANNNHSISPILRRVFSRSNLYTQTSHQTMGSKNHDLQRSESRLSHTSGRSGSSGTARGDLAIEVTTQENIQFMDQPLRGKIDLRGLAAPIESVVISLRGVVKTCVAGNAAWASGFGGDSNVLARFSEKEVCHRERSLTIDSEARAYITSMYPTCNASISGQAPHSPFCVSIPRVGESTAEHDFPSGTWLC
jgi:hypothetical protein